MKVCLKYNFRLSCLIILNFLLINNSWSQNNGIAKDNCTVCGEFMDSRPEIAKSAIAAWLAEPDDYLKYDLDIYFQDFDIFDEIDIPKWKAFVDEAHRNNKLVYADFRALTQLGKTFEYLMEDPGMQETVCLDVNLNSIKTPWLINKGYKDKAIGLFCGNNPRFRAYLRHQVFLLTETGIDGLVVDDFTGSPMSYSLGGCFCDHCMAGFREYLREKYSKQELLKLNIEDIDNFNYRELVLKYADDLNSLKMARNAGEVPLDNDFREFLYKSDADLFASLKEMACKLSGRYIEMGWDNVNFQTSRALYYNFMDLYYPEITYQQMALNSVFTIAPSSGNEALNILKNQKGDELLPPEIIQIYKFTDATNKWLSVTPGPGSWSAVKIKDMTGLLKLWLSFSYANGANFRYPTKGWCYGPTSRWYYPPKEEFEPYYAFIRANRDLFDDYEAIHQIGVLYCYSSSLRPLNYVCRELVNLNIPFGTPVSGNSWLKNRISNEDIDPYEIMIIPEPYRVLPEQQKIIDNWKTKKPLIFVREGDNIKEIIENNIDPLLSLESQSHIWMFPRYNPDNEKAPLVCHLINYDYDAGKNENNIQENIKIRISKNMLKACSLNKIYLYSVDEKPVKINYTEKDNNIYLTVPSIKNWGILKIEKTI